MINAPHIYMCVCVIPLEGTQWFWSFITWGSFHWSALQMTEFFPPVTVGVWVEVISVFYSYVMALTESFRNNAAPKCPPATPFHGGVQPKWTRIYTFSLEGNPKYIFFNDSETRFVFCVGSWKLRLQSRRIPSCFFTNLVHCRSDEGTCDIIILNHLKYHNCTGMTRLIAAFILTKHLHKAVNSPFESVGGLFVLISLITWWSFFPFR